MRAQYAIVSSTRRRAWVLVVALLAAMVVGVAWYLRRGPPGAAAEAGAVAARSASPPAAAIGVGPGTEAASPRDAPAPGQHSDARAKRDALRAQILRQLAQRPATPSGGSTSPPSGSSNDPPSGGLRNRLDDRHQAVVDQMNRDFMPLASECVEQAQQRTPQLAGMLALSMEAIADEQLGAVVDAAELAPNNQVVDPLLFECLRESAFSMSLPPPPTGGRMRVEVTIRIDPGSGSGSGSGARP
jgi:hypothetical protein